jgi:hypothetical protein
MHGRKINFGERKGEGGERVREDLDKMSTMD